MSENKYLVYLDDRDAKNNGCISGWYIHDIKVKKIEKKLIGEFQKSRDRIILKMKERYGYTAKGNEYLENLFKEEFKKIDEIRDHYQKKLEEWK